MADVEHPIGFKSQLHRAFAERVIWQTVGIINCVRTPIPLSTGGTYLGDELGTGSACRWEGKKIILTAGHVIGEAKPSELRFFLRPNGEIDWNVRSAQPAFAQVVTLGIEKIVKSKPHDLAAIVLDGSESNERQMQYCALPGSFATVPPPGSGVFIAGFPVDQSVQLASTRSADGAVHNWRAALGIGCWPSVVDHVPPYFPSAFDPDLNFLLRFDPSEEGAFPHGFSGTGVWYQGASKPDLWMACPVLAGVQISWHRPSNLMIGVRSDVVRRFLEEDIR